MFVQEEEKLGKIYDSRIVSRLTGYLKPDWWMIALAAILGVPIALTQLAQPIITQRTIDQVFFSVTRLYYLDPKVAEEYGKDFYEVEDRFASVHIPSYRLYAVPQNRLNLINTVPKQPYDREEYYLLDKEKAQARLKPEVVASFAGAGKDKLLVPYRDLTRRALFPRRDLFWLREKDWQLLVKLAIIFLLVGVFRAAASFGQILLTTYAGQRSMHRLRTAIFKHLERMPVRFFDRNPVGRLVTRVTNDVETLSQFFSEVITSFFYDGFLIVTLMIAMPLRDWRLALVLFAIMPPMLVATIIFRRKLRDAFRKVRVRVARINAFLAENLSGIKVVQLFRRERKRLGEFKKINESHFQARFGRMMVFAIFRPIVDFLAVLALAALIWFGAHWIVTTALVVGAVTLGSLVEFLSYSERFFEPIRDLTEKFNLLQQAMASGERIFMLVDEPEENYEGRKLPRSIQGEIEFKNVWFAYNDDDWVLKDVNFKVKPGERVAIVGATGAGKTSIINLLSRFYEIERGQILLDGIDTRYIEKQTLRSQVGIVMQDVFLFLGDIETNIRLRSEMPHQRVKAAAEIANADKFISRLPQQYKAPVQERGVNLSAGERQLIAFARALAFDPAILVLDEATSSVDTKTEALIQDAIHKLLEGRTSLIIAHRLSTVRDANRIIVLDHGRIVEEGTHEALMARKGTYYGLYKLQFEHKI